MARQAVESKVGGHRVQQSPYGCVVTLVDFETFPDIGIFDPAKEKERDWLALEGKQRGRAQEIFSVLSVPEREMASR